MTTPKILYKYVRRQRFDILLNGRIRYTQPSGFNDPFEARPFIAGLADHAQIQEWINLALAESARSIFADLKMPPTPEDIDRAVQAFKKELDFTPSALESSILPAARSRVEDRILEQIGILSLTEVNDDLLMWSHYADGHAGFVIGFDTEHPYLARTGQPTDDFRCPRRVEYRQERPRIRLAGGSIEEIFLVKSATWAYEKEWRAMRHVGDAAATILGNGGPVYLFDVPTECIATIILGARMSTNDADTIRGILSDRKRFASVRIKQARPHESEFALVIGDEPIPTTPRAGTGRTRPRTSRTSPRK